MSNSTLAVRKGRKFDQVVEGARIVFLRDGFEGASVDDIAREAGVSKATLYSYFPDKRVLFLEIARDQCRIQADAAFELEQSNLTGHEALICAARIVVNFLISPFAQNIHSLALGEAERFPELAQEFYKSGPAMGRERLVMVFESLVARGYLAIDDLNFAAEQFMALCKTDIWVKVSLRVTDTPDPADIERVVNETVAMFVARYGA